MSNCLFPLCKSHAQSNGYCIGHKGYSNFTEVKVPKKVNEKSDKRKEEEKEYKKIVAEMMRVSNKCEIKEKGCTVIAEGLHHMKKRSPKTYLDKRYLIRACNNCNRWIEENPLAAIAKGYSVSKHKKEEA